MKFLLAFFTCTLLAIATPMSSLAADFQVLVQAQVPVNQIKLSELKKIYLGTRTFWDQSLAIHTTQLDTSLLTTSSFVEIALEMSITSYTNYWRRRVFSGRGLPPRILNSETELMTYISNTEGAIGFISKKTSIPNEINASVKVINIVSE